MAELEKYTIRPMKQEEISEVLAIRKSYHQQYGVHALRTLFTMDPAGIFVAVSNDGAIVGSCAAAQIGDNGKMWTVALHAVKSDLQRKRIGSQLWAAAMNHLGPDTNAYLICGVPDIRLYGEKLGFSFVVKGNIHYIRPGPADISKLAHQVEGVVITDYEHTSLKDLVSYDEGVVGYRREMYLELTLKEEGNFVQVAVCEGQIVGYGIISEDINGMALLRTVYADSRDIAEFLICSIVKGFPLVQEKGLTGLLFVKTDQDKTLEEKMGLDTIPFVKLCYRFEVQTGDISRQFVIAI